MKKIGEVDGLFNDETAGDEDSGKAKNDFGQFFTKLNIWFGS